MSNVYWAAKVDGDQKVSQFLKFVHFDSGLDWVFWDKLIFSTDQGKWELQLNTFAGQSGDGKNTQIVMGGKYETLDIPYDKAYDGIKLLLDGTNPIIRYQGKKYKFDYHVPQETLQELQRSMKLYEDLKVAHRQSVVKFIQKSTKDGGNRPFLFDPIMGNIIFVELVIYHLVTKYNKSTYAMHKRF